MLRTANKIVGAMRASPRARQPLPRPWFVLVGILKRALFFVVVMLALWELNGLALDPQTSTPLTPTLPDRMGFINDYANQISGSQQMLLEERLSKLKEEFGVEIVILTSIVDPFDEVATYAGRIIDAWQLGEKSILLVFARTGVDKWSYEFYLGREATGLFQNAEGKIEKLKSKLDFLVKRKSIKAAIQDTIDGLEDLLRAKDQANATQQESGFGFSFPSLNGVGYALLGIVGVLGLVFGVRSVLRKLCPRCGRRLRDYRGPARSYRRSGTYLSCPNCGYGRMR